MHGPLLRMEDASARRRLAEAYDGLARSLARGFPSRREHPEDLLQVARIGLLHAIERYDPSMGRPFVAFARPTITGELKRHIRDRTWNFRVPRALQERYLAVVRATDELSQELGRTPTVPELAIRVGCSTDEVLEAMELGRVQRPASVHVDPDSHDGAPEPGQADAGMARFETSEYVTSLLERLPEREQLVLRMRFFEELTQSEVAARLGTSQMWVSRLQAKALERLRSLTRGRPGGMDESTGTLRLSHYSHGGG